LADAAFDPSDPGIVYVVPVLVTPLDQGGPYRAAAKLELTGVGNYNLIELYGKNPATDPDQSHTVTDSNDIKNFVYEPDVYHTSEIEIDSEGNLFVLSTHGSKSNDWLMIYDESIGNDSEIRLCLNDSQMLGTDPNINPTAMILSSDEQTIYMAFSASISYDPNNLTTPVHRFAVERTDQSVTGLTYDNAVTVNCPLPQLCDTSPGLCSQNLGYISANTSITENPVDGTLYVAGLTLPKLSGDEAFPSQIDSIFTTPMLAAIPSGAAGPIDATVITGSDLALPLSIVWTGELTAKCGGADITGSSGRVDSNDFAVLASQWLDLPGIPSADIALPLDNFVDSHDLAVIAEHWLDTGCQ